jgi:hypothetical protein
MKQLKDISERFLLATGDRIWAVSPAKFRNGYEGKVFVICSTDVEYCVQAISSVQIK